MIPSPSSPARGRPLATTGTTRRPLPPVPGQPSRAAGHPDSRPPTLPSVPLPAAAQRRARTQSPGGGGGEKAAEPSPRGRGRTRWCEGSTWKSLSSLKRENLSAISRRPSPARPRSGRRRLRPQRRPPAPPPPHRACAALGSRARQSGSRDQQRRGSLTAAPTRGAEWLLQRDPAGRRRHDRPGDSGTPGVGTPRGRNGLARQTAPSGLCCGRSRPAESRCASDCRWQRACPPRQPMWARAAARARRTTNEGASSARACLAAN